MKTILMLSVSLMSLNAFAAPKALLQYTSHNGSVNPMYGTRVDCTVQDDGTVFIRKITGDIAHATTKAIAYGGVRNVTVLKSLISEAAKGQIVYPKTIMPIGGTNYDYTALAGKKEIVLLSKTGDYPREINRSEAATRLVKLLDNNCKTTAAE